MGWRGWHARGIAGGAVHRLEGLDTAPIQQGTPTMTDADHQRIAELEQQGVTVQPLSSGAFRFYGVNKEVMSVSALKLLTPADVQLLTGSRSACFDGDARRKWL